ncbi:hypothetical protein LT493_10975 [Streptomyces tricolor]|nr:hypothetical protein [Streptomyces tricolor]
MLTGTEKTLVTRNRVTGHSGKSPAVGRDRPVQELRGRHEREEPITGNRLADNSPADLVNQEATKRGNAFDGNSCRASKPAGLC